MSKNHDYEVSIRVETQMDREEVEEFVHQVADDVREHHLKEGEKFEVRYIRTIALNHERVSNGKD